MAKPRIADHALLKADGTVTENIEEATSISYKDRTSGLSTTFTPNPGGKAILWLALFGAKTIATNEASQVRQADGTVEEEIAGINDRFATMQPSDASVEPKWVDRTRVGGPRFDQPSVAVALVNVMVASGTWPDDESTKSTTDVNSKYSKALKAMADDSKKVSVFMSLDGVPAEYKKLRGTKVTSAADVADLLK